MSCGRTTTKKPTLAQGVATLTGIVDKLEGPKLTPEPDLDVTAGHGDLTGEVAQFTELQVVAGEELVAEKETIGDGEYTEKLTDVLADVAAGNRGFGACKLYEDGLTRVPQKVQWNSPVRVFNKIWAKSTKPENQITEFREERNTVRGKENEVACGANQEKTKLLEILHDPTPMVLQTLSQIGVPIAVSVSNEDLREISSSVVMTESWLRTHVLTYYPTTQITTIVVGNTIPCNNENWGLVLPSLKNIYNSLVRWGLEKNIKVSPFLPTKCLNSISEKLVIKPLFEFLHKTNSSCSIILSPNMSPSLVSSHIANSIKKLEFFQINEVNVLVSSNPMSRKLLSMNFDVVEPFPARPTPLPELPPSPIHSSIGFSVPAHVAKTSFTSPPRIAPSPLIPNIPFAPEPSNDGFFYPPCSSSPVQTPTAPEPNERKRLWCIAKPNVPPGLLQEAMDYACGEGGADCEEIKPNGSCFNPDNTVGHASYAFNSYWQKNKNNGGTCSFGGIAMVINADPSYLQCWFIPS
ncbi:hypothetical protein GIB67_030427 [Kingdonia uniflora]|uniref:X8 domain-containing protein n=1 Tax=Kingdonia uniflora TaxID=39325 RepID=A0A7J7NDK1_9MAGN|nr:hypothetical protein GIB67_030427 [Kingdonia uniflora]